MKKKFFYLSLVLLLPLRIAAEECLSCADLLTMVTNDPFHMEVWLQSNIYTPFSAIAVRDTLSLPAHQYLYDAYSSLACGDEAITKKCSLSLIFDTVPYGVVLGGAGEKSYTSIVGMGDFTVNNPDLFDLLFSQPQFSQVNFPLIGNLFDQVFVKQHRFGGVVEASCSYNTITCYGQIPLVYRIAYVFCPEQTQDRLSNELAQLFPSNATVAEPDTTSSFLKNTMVADSLGFDRSKIGVSLFLAQAFHGTFALNLLLPWGTCLKQGIIGGNYTATRNTALPFSLTSFLKDFLVNPTESCYDPSSGKMTFGNLFEGMLQRVTDGSYQVPFIHRPYGIEGVFSAKIMCNDHAEIVWDNSLTYNVPYTTYRYGVLLADTSLFPATYQGLSEEASCKVLNFFDEQFLERTLLVPFSVTATEGSVLQSTLSLHVREETLEISVGGDFWYRGREEVVPQGAMKERLTYAAGSGAVQLQLFGGIVSHFSFGQVAEGSLFAKGGLSVYSYGIGNENDFAVGITIVF